MKHLLLVCLYAFRRYKKCLKNFFVLAFICAAMGGWPAQASIIEWTLNNVTFSDGGTASGSFIWNSSTNAISTWTIQVSGGSTDFLAISYTPFQPSGTGGTLFGNNAGVTFSLFDSHAPAYASSSLRYLVLAMVAPLNAHGGSLAMATLAGGFPSQGFECFNCNPGRSVTSGEIEGVPVPIPPPIWLLCGSIPVWAGLAKRRKIAG
ncbi:MAG: hypothetical protein NTV43_17095 [Methylococcales bacterium]|nr:hypothetical protein [Methylococcales bacterium]